MTVVVRVVLKSESTLNAWKDFCRSQRAGGDNVFRVGPIGYGFEPRPRAQKNGALIGRFWRQDPGESPRDIGAFKINPDGSYELPPEAEGVQLPAFQPVALITECPPCVPFAKQEDTVAA